MNTNFQATMSFPPSVLPSDRPGSKPLVIGKFVHLDHEKQDVQIIQVLGVPQDLKPGKYDVTAEVRPKGQGKSGINYWYKEVKPA